MMRLTPLAALIFLAACQSPMGVVAPDPAPLGDPRTRLIAAVEAEGCVITPENATRIQQTAQLDEEGVQAIASGLAEEGLLELAGPQSVRFRTENCL